jgi:RNA-directed DNA polymerase
MYPALRQGGHLKTKNECMKFNWKKIHRNVRKLQARIVKAVCENKFNKAKSLMWLLVNSYYAKLIAVFRVITNKGGKTPGVDNVVWNVKTDLVPAAKSLRRRGYRPLPLRRIYIRKRNGKLRPLGIPTMKDRAMQALYLLALEPLAESKADPNSYGFRRKRACRDAIQQIFNCLVHKASAQWILEADIKGCFDNISHEWLLEHILIDKQILRKWLKAGYIEKQTKHPTIAGTPQGGIISPALMNLTLDGLEHSLKKHFPKIKGKKVNLIRYADDFIVTAHSKETLEKEILPLIRQFLSERGLSLSDEKTKITHINDGFDFLSQNTRRYPKGKLLIKPADNSVKEFKYKLRQVVFRNLGAKPNELINQLNPLLRGWSNYHKHIVSKEIFKEIDYYLWFLLGKWCKRRHPNKPWKWIREKYFSASGELCTFASVRLCEKQKVRINKIFRLGYIPILRHVKVKALSNPFDKADVEYFKQRYKELKLKSLKTKQNCTILKKLTETNKTLLNLWSIQPEGHKRGSFRNARAA